MGAQNSRMLPFFDAVYRIRKDQRMIEVWDDELTLVIIEAQPASYTQRTFHVPESHILGNKISPLSIYCIHLPVPQSYTICASQDCTRSRVESTWPFAMRSDGAAWLWRLPSHTDEHRDGAKQAFILPHCIPSHPTVCIYHKSSSDALSSSRAASIRQRHCTMAIVPSRKPLMTKAIPPHLITEFWVTRSRSSFSTGLSFRECAVDRNIELRR